MVPCPLKSQMRLPPWKNRVDFTGYPSNYFSGCRLNRWVDNWNEFIHLHKYLISKSWKLYKNDQVNFYTNFNQKLVLMHFDRGWFDSPFNIWFFNACLCWKIGSACHSYLLIFYCHFFVALNIKVRKLNNMNSIM